MWITFLLGVDYSKFIDISVSYNQFFPKMYLIAHHSWNWQNEHHSGQVPVKKTFEKPDTKLKKHTAFRGGASMSALWWVGRRLTGRLRVYARRWSLLRRTSHAHRRSARLDLDHVTRHRRWRHGCRDCRVTRLHSGRDGGRSETLQWSK